MEEKLLINKIPFKKSFILLFFLELCLALLFYINPIFSIALFTIPIFAFFIYFSTFVHPFNWLIFLIVASGLDTFGKIPGTSITLFHISWGIVILTFLFYSLYNNDTQFKIHTGMNKYVFLFVGYAFLSLLYSPNAESGLVYIITILSLFIIFLFIVNFLKTNSQLKVLIYTLLILNVFNSFLIYYQILFQNVLFIGRDTAQSLSGEKIWRASGTFDDPNVTATYLLIGIVFSFAYLILNKTTIKQKLFIIPGILITSGGLILTFSRTGWLAAFVGIIIVVFFQKDKRKMFTVLFLIILFVVVVSIFTPYGEFIFARFLSVFDIMKDPSIRTRIFMGISGIWMFLNYPILGVGYRGFPKLYDYFQHPLMPQSALYIKESHTLWITLLAELGIIGLLIVLFWFKEIIVTIFKSIKFSSDPLVQSVLKGTFAIFIALNVSLLFYGNLFPHFNEFWILLGIVYAIQNNFVKDSVSA